MSKVHPKLVLMKDELCALFNLNPARLLGSFRRWVAPLYTGRVGKEVVARLSKTPGWTVRAATRDKQAYATSLGAHETVNFDLTDQSTWGPAMEGVTHLFSSTQDKYIQEHMVGLLRNRNRGL